MRPMNTPSHFLVNAALGKSLPQKAIAKSAFLLGSVAPDLPLYLLSIGALIYYHYIKGWTVGQAFRIMFDELYFQNPYWVASHNLLHSPLVLLVYLALLWRFRGRRGSRRYWWFWFFAGCLLHTALDIPTHVDDGPLLFFPLEWTIRFQSPVSYWDDRHYGREFSQFEAILDIILLAYLLIPPIFRYLRRRASKTG